MLARRRGGGGIVLLLLLVAVLVWGGDDGDDATPGERPSARSDERARGGERARRARGGGEPGGRARDGDGASGRPGGSGTPQGSVRARVLRVIDGDTISVELGGETENVRYIGVDTPETVKPGSPVECFGPDAAALNRELVEGRTVRIRFDRERRDRYGRLLGYVHVRGTFVNAALVRRGAARTLEIPPNTSRAPLLRRLERAASIAGRGLWGEC